ncbi:LysR family transcriptional regulator [Roseibium sp. M-1]
MKREIGLRHLRYAAIAAQLGSFRRAAEELCIKQSTLSRCVLQLEARIGVLLFERSSGGVRLTAAGVEIMRTSRYLVDTFDHLLLSAEEIGQGHAGRVTIGFNTSLSTGKLRASLIDFWHRFPNVEIRTVEGSRERLRSGLASGAVDVAVTTGTPLSGKAQSMTLWTERVIAALPESHRFAKHNVVHWTDLKDDTFLISQNDPGLEFSDIIQAKLARPGKRPNVILHEASRETIKSLVGADFGITLTAEASMGAKYAGVVYREVCDGNGPSRINYAAHWRHDNDNPALANFIALLEERYPSPAGLD